MSKFIITDIVKKNKTVAVRPIQRKEKIEDIKEELAKKKRRFWSNFFLLILAILIFFLFLDFIINLFSSVLVKITPVQEFANIDLNLKAQRNSAPADLPFEIVQMEYEENQNITATGVSADGQKASGQIIIYNTYDSGPQILIKNTRFEAPGGKIYRIYDKVSVPGNGSVEVAIYADQPGEEYNIGLADFTIPGFKGDLRYEKIYARSKTKMTGGSKNASNFLTEDDINKVSEDLKNKIGNYLAEKILKQKPDDYVFFSNGLVIDFSENPDNSEKGDAGKEFVFSQKGTATGFLFKEEDFSKEIVKRYLSENNIGKAGIANLDKLEFNLLNHNQDNTEITFGLKGRAHFVWKIDGELLMVDLTAMDSNDYGAVFKKYPAIESAEVIFKPSWWHVVPKNKSRIHLEEIIKSE